MPLLKKLVSVIFSPFCVPSLQFSLLYLITSIPLQLSKTPLPIYFPVIELQSILVKLGQLAKDQFLILRIVGIELKELTLSSFIFVSLNAFSPISCNVCGHKIVWIFVFLKAASLIEVILVWLKSNVDGKIFLLSFSSSPKPSKQLSSIVCKFVNLLKKLTFCKLIAVLKFILIIFSGASKKNSWIFCAVSFPKPKSIHVTFTSLIVAGIVILVCFCPSAVNPVILVLYLSWV